MPGTSTSYIFRMRRGQSYVPFIYTGCSLDRLARLHERPAHTIFLAIRHGLVMGRTCYCRRFGDT